MDLAELIAESKRRSARTYDQLSRDCGGDPSGKRLQQFVTQPIREFPKPETIRALAVGLKVTETTVVLSAAQSLGLDVAAAPSRLIEMMPPRADMLSDEEAESVAHLVRTMLNVKRAQDATVTQLRPAARRPGRPPSIPRDD